MTGFIDTLAEYSPVVKARGYFPSVFIAQSILESGWGLSPLTKFNNLWGHKWKDGDEWSFVPIDTPEERDGQTVREVHRFRHYPDMTTAVNAYCDKWEERWKNGNMKYNPDFSSPYGFVLSIAKTYATDSGYAGKLCRLIDEWGLTKYDL